MKKYCLLFISFAIFSSCTDPEDNLPSEVYEVTTLGISADCRLNVLKFDDEDLERLEELTGRNNLQPSLREGLNLDRNRFGEPNLRLSVRIRKTLDSEAVICTAWQISHPSVYVISARKID
jgi:hypothetical protein